MRPMVPKPNRHFALCSICGLPTMSCPHRSGGRATQPVRPPTPTPPPRPMKPKRPSAPPKLPPQPRNDGELLAQFVIQNMKAPEINQFPLILLARERGSAYKAKANPRPDVFTTIRGTLARRPHVCTSRGGDAERNRARDSSRRDPLVSRHLTDAGAIGTTDPLLRSLAGGRSTLPYMRVCIHRGAAEVGGNVVEVEHEGARVVLDVGLLSLPRSTTKACLRRSGDW